jgi:acetyl-CoA acetyltransferase
LKLPSAIGVMSKSSRPFGDRVCIGATTLDSRDQFVIAFRAKMVTIVGGNSRGANAEAAGVLWAVKEKARPGGRLTARQRARNHRFGKVRAKVEHVFRVVNGMDRPRFRP